MQKIRRSHILRVRLGEFILPPIEDGLVLGRDSPIGPVAVGKALGLLTSTPFEHVPVEEDEVIGDLLVRSAILRKISSSDLVAFVLQEIRPLMGPEEILHLHLDIELQIEGKSQ